MLVASFLISTSLAYFDRVQITGGHINKNHMCLVTYIPQQQFSIDLYIRSRSCWIIYLDLYSLETNWITEQHALKFEGKEKNRIKKLFEISVEG